MDKDTFLEKILEHNEPIYARAFPLPVHDPQPHTWYVGNDDYDTLFFVYEDDMPRSPIIIDIRNNNPPLSVDDIWFADWSSGVSNEVNELPDDICNEALAKLVYTSDLTKQEYVDLINKEVDISQIYDVESNETWYDISGDGSCSSILWKTDTFNEEIQIDHLNSVNPPAYPDDIIFRSSGFEKDYINNDNATRSISDLPYINGIEYGSISFTSDPPYATIYLDGLNTDQQTPSTITNIPSGLHTYTLKKVGYKSKFGTVNVIAGETATIDEILEPEEPQPNLIYIIAGLAIALLVIMFLMRK